MPAEINPPIIHVAAADDTHNIFVKRFFAKTAMSTKLQKAAVLKIKNQTNASRYKSATGGPKMKRLRQ